MPIRKVLLPLSGTEAGRSALVTAWTVARMFDAHLSCIHVRLDSRDVAPLAGEGLSGAMIEEMMQASESESGLRAAAAGALFDRFRAEHDIPDGPATREAPYPSASFVSMVGREDDMVAQLARLADLTVVPHPEADEDLSSSDALHAVLFDSGRPVLIAPATPPVSVATRVAVAWNGTAESSAAVWGAMPFLERAQAVCILASDEYYRRGPQAQALAEFLLLHGVRAEMTRFKSVDREVGAGLLAAARAFGADLLTMGAYSHSRIRQLILGGVTRHVLEKSDLPVLMNR